MEKVVQDTPGMDPSTRANELKFLSGFWDDISSPEQIQKNVLKTCR